MGICGKVKTKELSIYSYIGFLAIVTLDLMNEPMRKQSRVLQQY